MYLLVDNIYKRINKDQLDDFELNYFGDNYLFMINNILKARNFYFDKHNINAITNSPFEEFITKCIGKVINDRRLVRLANIQKYKIKKTPLFKYDPAGYRNIKIPTFSNRFLNSLSGKKFTSDDYLSENSDIINDTTDTNDTENNDTDNNETDNNETDKKVKKLNKKYK